MLKAAAGYIDRNGCVVRYGPFAGMVYSKGAALSRISIPKLLGTYEQELHPILQTISTRKYDLIIDIGAAEGYYAVGLARMFRTKVLAFDPEPIERRFSEEIAEINGMKQFVSLRNLFLRSDIDTYSNLRVLCLCDCEGFEKSLFDQETVKKVGNWDLIVELHGDAEQILPPLPWPHPISLIPSTTRVGEFEELKGLELDSARLLSEFRSAPQKWLWCDGSVN